MVQDRLDAALADALTAWRACVERGQRRLSRPSVAKYERRGAFERLRHMDEPQALAVLRQRSADTHAYWDSMLRTAAPTRREKLLMARRSVLRAEERALAAWRPLA